MTREARLRAATMAIGLVAGAALGEVALRVHAAVTGRSPADADVRRTRTLVPPVFDGSCEGRLGASLAALVLPSAHPRVIYELKPSLDTCFYRARVRTNEAGLRAGTPRLPAKAAGVRRLLVLGDSQAFGWGVEYEDTVGVALERALAERGHRVEVVNAAVPGYNAAQEAAFLAARGRELQPDCALVLFMGNDFDPPLFRAEAAPAPRPRSYLFTTARRAWRRWRQPAAAEAPPLEALAFGPHVDFLAGADLSEVPPEYRDMVGLPGYRRALEAFAEASRSLGVPVVDFADYSYLLSAEQAAALHREQVARGLRHPEFAFPRGAEFRLADDDPHLSPAGHRELARRMAAALRAGGECLGR